MLSFYKIKTTAAKYAIMSQNWPDRANDDVALGYALGMGLTLEEAKKAVELLQVQKTREGAVMTPP